MYSYDLKIVFSFFSKIDNSENLSFELFPFPFITVANNSHALHDGAKYIFYHYLLCQDSYNIWEDIWFPCSFQIKNK